MNSKMLIVGAIALILIAGAGFFVLNSKQTTSNNPPTPSQPTPVPTNINNFSSIKDALTKSVSLECSFVDEQGKQTKSYIKNGAVRVDFTGKTSEQSGSTIMKDKKMYFWNTSQKTGFMMELTDAQMKGEAIPTTTKSTGTPPQGQNTVETLEKYKDSCKPAVVSDSLFTPPADIKFTDYSQILKTPTGTTSSGSGSINQQQIQDLMQKYAPTNTP